MREVARALIETESVLIRPEEPFRLASGRLSPVYVDCRRLLSFPKERALIVNALAELVRRELPEAGIEVLAGGETAGIPFAALLAEKLEMPLIYVRKAPKGYGRTAQIEGVLHEGQRVLLVEDLVTDGGSKLAFQAGIERAGGVVEHCVCVFEYYSEQAGLAVARRRLAEEGIALHSLTHWDELLEELESRGALSPSEREAVLGFLSRLATEGESDEGA